MKITTARSVHHLVELALIERWVTVRHGCAGCGRAPLPDPARNPRPGGPGRDGGERIGPGRDGGAPRPPALTVRLCARLLMSRPPADWSGPAADGRYGPDDPADPRPLTLLLLGDSLALGPGAARPEETLGARLARSLGEHLDRPVDLRVLARPGATTAALRHQLAGAARLRPGIAVVVVGGADALLPFPVGRAVRRLALVLRRLRDTGWHPVVVPCPDPGLAPGLRAPARLLGAPRARRLARRQIRVAERTGAAVAPAAGPGSAGRAGHLLGPDGVHPSARGRAEHAARMLPALLAAAEPLRGHGAGAPARPHPPARAAAATGARTAAGARTGARTAARSAVGARSGTGAGTVVGAGTGTALRSRRPTRRATPPPSAPAATTAPPSRPAPAPASPAGPPPAPDATAPRA
ncbi:GDSL-type esterase/lipase family protein [Kitasatospora sp. NPDC094019]|uniref:GDSL-type esterase/lipase family protein n=1 Tax=Kitasatospora sp. NPDC094019 TaxID=3364091 RepID=UPI00382DB040